MKPQPGTRPDTPDREAKVTIGPRVRFAVIGLGHISQTAVLPAFTHVQDVCELVALVSDDAQKLDQLSRTYAVERSYTYEQYDECLASGIDAVFIALPNSLHHPYAVKAALAGVHILCEKPMAISVEECEEMIAAAEAAQVKLMIAYRLHFERANLRAVAIANAEKLGELRFFNSTFSMQVKPDDIRVRAALGGGTVMDLGIYCINAARYLFRDEPTEVFAMSARSTDSRFAEVDEMTSVVLRFPGERLATFISSFGAAATAAYELVGTKGVLRVDPAYEYTEVLRHRLTIDGKTSEEAFPVRDQFAAELLYFARCILDDEKPEPSGEEGLADLQVIAAIYRSAKLGKPIAVKSKPRRVKRPRPDQVIDMPAPISNPPVVNTRSPSDG